MSAPEVKEVTITQRETHFDKSVYHADARAFSDVRIETVGGRFYLSRLWYAIPDTPFSRAEQAAQFKNRMERYDAQERARV